MHNVRNTHHHHLCLRSLSGRARWCGTSWKISAPPARSCRFSIFLCRRWLETLQTPCGSWISRLPSRLSKCPRSLALRVHRVLLFLSRRRRKQLVEVPTVLSPTRIALRIAEQIVDTPVPRGRGQGSLPGQSTTATHSSGKRISERIVEQIVDFPEQTVEQIVDISPGGGLGQGSASSAGAADEDFTGFFRTFPRGKKVRVPPRVRVRSCRREVSSWTPAACGETIGSDEWVQFSRRGKPFYWNRRSHETFWTPPEGVKVVWIGEQTAAGEVWYWHKETRVSTYDLPPLPPG